MLIGSRGPRRPNQDHGVRERKRELGGRERERKRERAGRERERVIMESTYLYHPAFFFYTGSHVVVEKMNTFVSN